MHDLSLAKIVEDMLEKAERLAPDRLWVERRGLVDGKRFAIIVAVAAGASALDDMLERNCFVDPRSTGGRRDPVPPPEAAT